MYETKRERKCVLASLDHTFRNALVFRKVQRTITRLRKKF